MSIKREIRKVKLNIISFFPRLVKKYFNDNGDNNRIIIVKDGVEKIAKPRDFPYNKVTFIGNNNVLKIHYPTNLRNSSFYFNKNNGLIEIKSNQNINVEIHCQENDRTVTIDSGCYCLGAKIFASSNDVKIGKNCMFSENIVILGDNHAVIDYQTRQVINNQSNDKLTVIGDHVWVGGGVVLTKNANVSNDCIIAFASVVTKKFDEEHCIIAGNPAKIVKTGISWNSMAPHKYDKEIAKDMLV